MRSMGFPRSAFARRESERWANEASSSWIVTGAAASKYEARRRLREDACSKETPFEGRWGNTKVHLTAVLFRSTHAKVELLQLAVVLVASSRGGDEVYRPEEV